jgi:2-phospho-L-lactate guanylyltransferase (CobY/MobA/RfbA family)|tara:strand:- start:24 stop:629 length:606 start_codon:yes stop_codon:yes gene_type:complete
MNRKNIIGIPIKNLENPMSRLAKTLDKKQRIALQIGLIRNIVECFKDNGNDIFLISNDLEIKKLANQLKINYYNTNSSGLNKEVIEFSNNFKNYKGWIICHSDLPYVTKFFAKTISQEMQDSDILIAKSKDTGTPFMAGSVNFSDFKFGVNSFKKHTKFLMENNYEYKQIYSTEFTYELDDESDYQNFLLNQPRWFKKLKI